MRTRHLADLLELSRELDLTFADAERGFDREPRHTGEGNFAPTAELTNDEVTKFVIPPSSPVLTTLEELDRQLSKTAVDPAYLEFEVRSIY